MILNRTYLTDHFLIIVAPQMLKYILAILWNPFNIIDLCYLNEINNAKRNHLIILYELFNETFPRIIIQYQDILYHSDISINTDILASIIVWTMKQ